MQFQFVCFILSLIGVAFSAPVITDLWDFPNGTWVENLALRSNGQILVTLVTSPQIYQVDPTRAQPAKLVHTFPGYLGLLGITEVQPDVFYVVAGNFSTVTFESTPGSYSVFEVDLATYASGTQAAVSKIADFPESNTLNGMTTLDSCNVLIADSGLGAVWKLNVDTGATCKVISDPLMDPNPAAGAPPLGINGVQVKNSTLYFTNTDQAIYASIPINTEGTATGPAETLTTNIVSVDDFGFAPTGIQLFAGNSELRRVPPGGGDVDAVSDNPLFAGSTAVKINEKVVAFVTTNGGIEQYRSRVFTNPGKLVSVDNGGQ